MLAFRPIHHPTTLPAQARILGHRVRSRTVGHVTLQFPSHCAVPLQPATVPHHQGNPVDVATCRVTLLYNLGRFRRFESFCVGDVPHQPCTRWAGTATLNFIGLYIMSVNTAHGRPVWLLSHDTLLSLLGNSASCAFFALSQPMFHNSRDDNSLCGLFPRSMPRR
jgi:hypothetical protein